MNKKSILKTLIFLSVPTVLEQIMATLLQYVDTAMVGQLGENATSAVSITTTITWLVNSIPSAMGVGILSLISRAVGSRDDETIKKLSRQALIFVAVFGTVLGGISVLLSPYIPKWMGAEEIIQKQASTYFLIISLPMIFRVASSLFATALRAVEDTKTPMIINFCGNILNIVFNYIFIYVLSLGVTGAAISTAISYTLTGIVMFTAYRRKEILRYKLSTVRFDRDAVRECCKISFPVLMTSITSCIGYVVFARLVANMGTIVFAAHSIAVSAETVFYISGYGLRTATSTMIGISIGERDRDKFNKISRISIVLTICMMILSGAVLYIVSNPFMNIFTSSSEVSALGAQMLRIVAFSEPFFGIMIVMEGIFYGVGRTKYPFVVETFSMWCIRIAFTALCVNAWQLDLSAVWYCMIADNVAKAILLSLPMLSKRSRNKLFNP